MLPLSYAVCGLAVVIAGTIGNYWIGLLAVAMTGMGFATATSTLFAAIQLLSPAAQRGRAIALYLVVDLAGAALGVLIFSWASEVASIATAAASTGTALVVIAGLLVLFRPRLKILD